MEKLSKKLKEKLKSEGRSQKWFLKTYLPDHLYSTIVNQINGYSKMSNELIKAISKYLKK